MFLAKNVQKDMSKHILFAVYFDHNRCQILGLINRNQNPFDPMIDYNRSSDEEVYVENMMLYSQKQLLNNNNEILRAKACLGKYLNISNI